MQRSDQRATVEPSELRLDRLAAVETARHEHGSTLAEGDQSKVERFVVQRAEAEPVLHLIGSAIRVPLHVCGFEPERDAVEPGIETADRAPVAVCAKH